MINCNNKTRLIILFFFYSFFMYIITLGSEDEKKLGILLNVPYLMLFFYVFLSKDILSALKNKISIIFICLLIIFGYLISYLYSENTNFAPLFFFIFPLLYARLAPIHINSKDIKILHILFWCIMLYNVKNFKVSVLTTHFFNGNNFGLIVVICGIFLVLLTPLKKNYHRLYFLLILAYVFPALIASDSRNCIVIFCVFVLAKLVSFKIIKSKFYIITNLLLTFGSFLYVTLYIQLFKSNISFEQFFSFLNSDKVFFSGRQYIWDEGLSILSNNIWGLGTHYNLTSFETNELHNFVLELFVTHGIIVGSLILILLNIIIFPLLKNIDDSFIRNCVFAYFAFLFLNFNETFLLSHNICLLPLYLAYSRQRELYKNSTNLNISCL